MSTGPNEVLQDEEKVKKIERWAHFPKDNLPSIESLFTDIHNTNLNRIRLDSIKEYAALTKRQDEVAFMHKLISAITAASTDKGELDLGANEELQAMLKRASELGIKIPQTKNNKLNVNQRDQLVGSIRMTVDDENTMIELHMHKLQNLNYELHESYQWMRTHLKTLDEIKRKFTSRIDINR